MSGDRLDPGSADPSGLLDQNVEVGPQQGRLSRSKKPNGITVGSACWGQRRSSVWGCGWPQTFRGALTFSPWPSLPAIKDRQIGSIQVLAAYPPACPPSQSWATARRSPGTVETGRQSGRSLAACRASPRQLRLTKPASPSPGGVLSRRAQPSPVVTSPAANNRAPNWLGPARRWFLVARISALQQSIFPGLVCPPPGAEAEAWSGPFTPSRVDVPVSRLVRGCGSRGASKENWAR